MTATEPRPLQLDVDLDLLEHRQHLPETTECRCGYQRKNRFYTLGTLILETGFEIPSMHVTVDFGVPAQDWFGNADTGFCGATAPWPAFPSQCVGRPGHTGPHASLSDDWVDTLGE